MTSKQTIIVAFDPGTSLTKVIYSQLLETELSRPKLLTMEPTVTEITDESIKFYQKRKLLETEAKNESWIKIQELCYAVGTFAQNQFQGFQDIKSLKYELAVLKILSAVGIIAEQEKLPESFDLSLAVPLPYSEWEDQDQIQEEIKVGLSNFIHRGKTHQVNLDKFLCVPEGGGHALYCSQQLKQQFLSMKIVSLMMGYRDISLITFDQGKISGQTASLGLAQMLSVIKSRTSGQTERRLLKPVHSALDKIAPNQFKSLVLSRNQNNQAIEAEKIAIAVQTARHEYLLKLSQWLSINLEVDTDQLIVGGGTAFYVYSSLSSFLKEKYPQVEIIWGSDLEKDVEILFNLSDDSDMLTTRITDVYALYDYFASSLVKSISRSRSTPKQ